MGTEPELPWVLGDALSPAGALPKGPPIAPVTEVFGLIAFVQAGAAWYLSAGLEKPLVPPEVLLLVYGISLIGAFAAAMILVLWVGKPLWPASAPRLVEPSSPRRNHVGGPSMAFAGPIGLLIVFVAVAGALLPTVGDKSLAFSRVNTTAVLFLALAWPLCGVWSVVSLRLEHARIRYLKRGARGRGASVPSAAGREWLRPLPSLVLAAMLTFLLVFPSSPPSPFRIDGNMAKWADVPSHTDPLGDGVVVVSEPRFSLDYLVRGTYQAVLNVTDSGGASAETRVSFSVPNAPPIAMFTDSVSGLNVTFNGTGSSDADDAVSRYDWAFGDGSAAEGLVASHLYYASGSFSVTLTVTDARGASSSQERTITVRGPNRPPVARIAFSLDNYSLTVSAARSNDPDGSIASVSWEFGDGGSASGFNATHLYTQNGTFAVNVTVVDNESASFTDSVSIPVPNPPPVPRFHLDVLGLTVTGDADNSTDDGQIVAMTWTFGDGGRGEGTVVRHRYAVAGSYAIVLTVRDNLGATSSLVGQVQVVEPAGEPLPPIANMSYAISNLYVFFAANGSYDPDGTIQAYYWDFGDGTGAVGPTVSHVYTSAGRYLARLSVVDGTGLTATTSTIVDLSGGQRSSSPPVPHVAVIVEGSTVTLDATGSMSLSGKVVKFRWALPNPTAGLDLEKVKVLRQGSQIFLYAEVVGTMFPYSNLTTTMAFHFETAANSNGLVVGGILPDFALRVSGQSGRLVRAELLVYVPSGLLKSQGTWEVVGVKAAASAGAAVEVLIPTSDLLVGPGSSFRMTCATTAFGLASDVLDTPVTI